jgi:pimeloyl-ACP methyl ester carboxylesterase
MSTRRNHDFLRMAELPRAGIEMASLLAMAPWLSLAPRGDRHPVVVLPGFLADDHSTRVLRRFLSQLGYQVHPWAQGRNLGAARMGGYEPLVSHVLRIHRDSGSLVSLVGWSLGGVHAVAVAQRAGYAIRQVLTLGSPLMASDETTPMFRALRSTARALNGQLLTAPPNQPLGVNNAIARIRSPITSVFSRTDGVVPWQRSLLPAATKRDNIEVHSSHVGLGFNPAVLYAVADRLAQQEDTFETFHRRGWRALTYPAVAER